MNGATAVFLAGIAVLLGSCGGGGVAPVVMDDPNGSLSVETGPFGFSVAGEDGAALLATAPGAGEPSALAFGVFDRLRDYHFYDPRNTQEPGWAARWKFAGRVTSKEPVEGGWKFAVETDPEVGRGLELTVTHEEGTGFRFALAVVEPAAVGFIRLTFEAAAGEPFYGLGERFDRADAAGGVYPMFTDISGEISSSINEVHVPVPFFVSGRGIGVFFEDPHPSCFDMGGGEDGRVRVTFSTGSGLVWHVITGETPAAVAARYGRLTGPAALPPVWAFAPMQWRNELDDGAQLLADAAALRENDIPTTVLWIDNPWQTAYNTFTFNELQFPDAAAMISDLEAMGYKAICWSTPYLDYTDDSSVREGMQPDTGGLFEEADAAGYFVTDSYGNTLRMPWKSGFGAGRIDFTRPEAAAFWQDLIGRVTSMGIVGFKLDYGEEIVPGALGATTIFHFSDGSDAQTMHKLYSVLYHRTYRERCLADAGESFIIGRSSTYGGQRDVEAIWPGDLDNDFLRHMEPDPDEEGKGAVGGLPSAICALQNLSVSGFPAFGSDTGGYRGGQPSKEVLLRWAEHTALTPIMQLGGGGDHHNPWDLEVYDQETLEVYRDYARLHTRLFPFFYTLAEAASERGVPPVLPVGMFDPADAEAPGWWDEYVIGGSLLVAPVHDEGASERDVRFPAGTWVDWWTGTSYEGRSTETVAAPIGTLPLFVLRGAVIPMLKGDVDTLAETADPGTVTLNDRQEMLYLHVVPAEAGGITLFEGTAVEVLDGADGLVVTLHQGGWFERFIAEIDWRNRLSAPPSGPATVTKDAATLENRTDYALVYDGECVGCWAWDGARGWLVVSTDGSGTIAAE
jgi:alpha-D-xyloside xylohydrolase